MVAPSDVCSEKLFRPEEVERAREMVEQTPVDPLAELFKVLGDRTRTGILTAISSGELCVCDLAELFSVTPGAISHQLRLLKAHRLVKARREGKMVFYSLDDDHVAGLMSMGSDHVKEGR